jgi:hypothetical protein
MRDVQWKIVLTQLDTKYPVFIYTGIFMTLSVNEMTQSDGRIIHTDELEAAGKVLVATWSR